MSYRTYVASSRAAYIAGIEAGISPQELRAHTGIIGEAFVADYLGVKLSAANNQPGHDLTDQNGLRVSVKTITTSTHVSLNQNTMHLVDRVVVVWLGTDADELDIIIVYDKSAEDFVAECAKPYRGSLRLQRNAMSFPEKPRTATKFSVGEIIDSFQDGHVVFNRHTSGSFTALIDGDPQPARQLLMDLRDKLDLPDKLNNTTRSLGMQVFGHLRRK